MAKSSKELAEVVNRHKQDEDNRYEARGSETTCAPRGREKDRRTSSNDVRYPDPSKMTRSIWGVNLEILSSNRPIGLALPEDLRQVHNKDANNRVPRGQHSCDE